MWISNYYDIIILVAERTGLRGEVWHLTTRLDYYSSFLSCDIYVNYKELYVKGILILKFLLLFKSWTIFMKRTLQWICIGLSLLAFVCRFTWIHTQCLQDYSCFDITRKSCIWPIAWLVFLTLFICFNYDFKPLHCPLVV